MGNQNILLLKGLNEQTPSELKNTIDRITYLLEEAISKGNHELIEKREELRSLCLNPSNGYEKNG